MKSMVFNMRYPMELIDRIDRFKDQKGFLTRAQAVVFLLQYALDKLKA